jgi:DNA-binding transcriptional LysR family regulator
MNLKNLDLNLLRVFEAVHAHRNTSVAAGTLGVTQPAVSNALKRLRTAFKDELFIKTAQGMSPTPKGAELARAIMQALSVLREGLEAPQVFDPARSNRHFTLAMSDIGEIIFLPKLLAWLKQAAPGVRLTTVSLPAAECKRAMENGEADLAVGFLPALKAGFFQQRVFTQKYVCMVRAGHPLAREPLSLKSFLACQQAMVNAEGTGHSIVRQVFERAGLEPDVLLTLPHFLAVPMVIAESELMVTVPQKLGEAFARVLPVKLLTHPVKIPPFQVNQYWHRRFHQDPANQWLRTNFARQFRE